MNYLKWLIIPRLNSVSLNRFCASHFLVWGSIWGFLTTANSMVLKVLTNSVGVLRYAYDKFYYFSHNCVGFTVMRRQNVLNSPTFTLNDIINNMELLLWCLPNIQWKPSLKCVKIPDFDHLTAIFAISLNPSQRWDPYPKM